MKARITINIDTDSGCPEPDSAETVERVVESVFAGDLRWALLSAGSSLRLARLWAEAQANGCRLAITEDAGHLWTARAEITDKGCFPQDTTLDDVRRVLTSEELCAEAMVAEIGEIVNREEATE